MRCAFLFGLTLLCFTPLLGSCDTADQVVSPELLSSSDSTPGRLWVGAAAVSISPTVPVPLAGGIPYRPTLALHDELWARAVVFDNGRHRFALVALDLIGMDYDDVVRTRKDVTDRVAVDYVLIACTHTHNAPDLVGVWAGAPGCEDPPYRQQVGQAVAQAVQQAAAGIRPARLRIASSTSGQPPLSDDNRMPRLIDDTLVIWQARDADTDETIATAVHYAVHPILVPSLNFDVSSDFVHYLRDALERGMIGDDGPLAGDGGVALFFNAALAGRITPAQTRPLEIGGISELPYQRAQAYGYRLARRSQTVLAESGEWLDEALPISIATRQIRVDVTNPLLLTWTRLCMVDRPLVDGQVISEVGRVWLGPIDFFAVPGMLFPEHVLGGFGPVAVGGAPLAGYGVSNASGVTTDAIDAATADGELAAVAGDVANAGSDFPSAAPESPVLSQLTTGRHRVVIGLANDMLGYLVPEVLWDERPPFTTPDSTAPYGEQVSPGRHAARTVLEGFATLRRPD